jgi:hypothetical protein
MPNDDPQQEAPGFEDRLMARRDVIEQRLQEIITIRK